MAKRSSRMLGQKNLFPKDDDDKFSRLLSREGYNSSKQGDSSFRVLYYAGAAGSVPFLWESQPGTPKHTFNNNPPPPLTPPPYYQSSPRAKSLLHKKSSKNFNIINSIFQKNLSKKFNNAKSSLLYSSSSSSRSSSIYEYEVGECSPTSTLCFGHRIKGYYYPIKSVKKVVLSIVGHGTAN